MDTLHKSHDINITSLGILLQLAFNKNRTITDIEQVLREKKSFTLRYMLDGIKDDSGEGGHMEQVRVERLDHLGLLASVIKDLGLIAMLDKRLVPNEQEVITPGEAVAGMILNGLGFAHRPLSLTPQFFANKPLDLLFRKGID